MMEDGDALNAEGAGHTAPAVLRTARPWISPEIDATTAHNLARQLGCPLPIACLIVSRGIDGAASARQFFHPGLNDLHDPLLMLGMVAAVERIRRAVAGGETILIYGDYDVDGTTATVLLKIAIERIAQTNLAARVRYHVPHRIREGYGMQTNVLGDAAIAGVSLVISVDTGIRAFAAADEAKSLGLDLIVTDHHLPDDVAGVPEAVAVINPAQAGCPYPFKSLCGAAVAFKLAYALMLASAETEALRERLQNVLVPSFLKLVAIATIADSVPLVGENRVIAALGLRELRNPVQPGLRALMQVAQIPLDRAPTASEVGFRLAPRINAAGRMDVASDVVELFLTRDKELAQRLAEKLDRLNSDRRDTEALALESIETQLAAMKSITGEFPADCIILDDPEWHRGVLGILASRVVDRTSRPALVLTHEDGQAHGSGRSVEGFHLLDALTAAHGSVGHETMSIGPIFTRFGGHAHAVGFSLPSDRLIDLRKQMARIAGALFATRPALDPFVFDVEIGLAEITDEFERWLCCCAPFGNGNAEPIFVSRGVRLSSPPRTIKDRHICLSLDRGDGSAISAMGWSRRIDWIERCKHLALDTHSQIDVAYHVRRNSNARFAGLELELCEVRLAG
jgi:single-stranded-DNA-specific exonuclease